MPSRCGSSARIRRSGDRLRIRLKKNSVSESRQANSESVPRSPGISGRQVRNPNSEIRNLSVSPFFLCPCSVSCLSHVMSTLVSFLWHMHQPFYKDVVRNIYVMPWAYLHATKDYFGMPALAGEFPEVHQTFNLVPSLIVQLEEYANGDATDPLFQLAFKPAGDLTDADRAEILQKFFPVPVRTMVQPFPRYFELYERRSHASGHHEWTAEDFRDVQVWWTLSWIGQDKRPPELIQKGRGFSEADKKG